MLTTASETGIVGQVTPYLVFPTPGPKISCSPINIGSTEIVKCPVANTDLTPGLYTISFSQYSSSSNKATGIFLKATTLSSVGPDVTISVTPTSQDSTAVRSSVVTVTAYEKVVVVNTLSTSTLTGSITSTVGVCSPAPVPVEPVKKVLQNRGITIITTTSSSSSSASTTKPLVCNHDNCLRAFLGRTDTATAFCATYTQPPVIPSAFADTCQSNPSCLSSACGCAAAATAPAGKRDACNHNNCLRAMLGHSTDAAAFCATYTQPLPTPSAFANSCQSDSTRLSSACSCAITAVPDPVGPVEKIGVEKRGIIIATTTTSSAAISTTTTPMVCNHNNCLPAMLGRTDAAADFCATYTAPPVVSTPAAFANGCQSNPLCLFLPVVVQLLPILVLTFNVKNVVLATMTTVSEQ